MTTKIYPESSAEFTFDSDRLYLPEEEPFQQKLQDVNVCDFVYLTAPAPSLSNVPEQLLIIEVKTNAPKDTAKFAREEIEPKFVSAILTYVGAWVGRPKTTPTNLPPLFRSPNALKKQKITLVLIITHPDFKDEWLPPLKASLRKQCRHIEQAFSLEKTQVYNLRFAQKVGQKYGFQVKSSI